MARRWPGLFDAEDRHHCTDDGEHEGDDRDRGEETDDPGQGRPRRQGDEHDRRVDVDRPVIDDRRQELALDDVEDRDQDEQDEGRRLHRRWPTSRTTGRSS